MFEGLDRKQFIPVSRVIVVAFLLMLVVLVGNGVTGFTTSLIKLQEAATNATHTRVMIENLAKESNECSTTLNNTAEMFDSCRSELEIKKTENTRLISETSLKESNITTYVNSVTVLQKEVAELRGLSNSLAINICCLRRYVLEDDSLRYYYIQKNKTFCVSQPDEVLETKGFSC